MTDINAPFTFTASAMGEADDKLFEKIFTELCQKDLRTATSMELSFALGVAAGTILRLRKELADVKQELADELALEAELSAMEAIAGVEPGTVLEVIEEGQENHFIVVLPGGKSERIEGEVLDGKFIPR